MRNRIVGIVAVTALIVPAAVQAAPVQTTPAPTAVVSQELTPGTASGQLVVGDQTFSLVHSYVMAVDDLENERGAGPQKSVWILVSDAPVAEELRRDYFRLATAARDKQLHAVLLKYDPKTKSLFNVIVFAIRPGAKETPQNISLSGTGSSYPLEYSVTDGIASGTARMAKPGEIMSFEEQDPGTPPRTYTYMTTFRATIENLPPVTAMLTGKEAKASPQVAAATRFFAACHAGNIAEVRRLILPNPEMEKMFQEKGATQIKQMLKQFSPSPTEFAKMAKKVIVRGNKATVIAGDVKSAEGQIRIKAVITGGKWVISQ